ncbi:hypothetical protein, partial [Nocardia exalbida]|uniref:hypothetical protein n=1 Tax=Nocardia exalbida TaxID=290231 RepID=UPI001FDEF06F
MTADMATAETTAALENTATRGAGDRLSAAPSAIVRAAMRAAPAAVACAGSAEISTGRPSSASVRATSAGRTAPPTSRMQPISDRVIPDSRTHSRTSCSESCTCAVRNPSISTMDVI